MSEENTQTRIKLFGKWTFHDVKVSDISLKNYIACGESSATFLPHSAICWSKKQFQKAKCPIVERLTNSMMMHGRNAGKKLMAVRIVKHAFEIINLLTAENPIQVLVNAVSVAGPREDCTRIGSSGVVRVNSVDVSPLRRVNIGIYLICLGARKAAFKNPKTIAEALAEEIIATAKGDTQSSYSLTQRETLERVAKNAR